MTRRWKVSSWFPWRVPWRLPFVVMTRKQLSSNNARQHSAGWTAGYQACIRARAVPVVEDPRMPKDTILVLNKDFVLLPPEVVAKERGAQ